MTRRRRLLVLGICSMSLFIVAVDNTIVNVALPAIGADLHASVSGLQWVVDAYTLVLASLLMLAGSTGDRLGRRHVFQAGLVTFAVASLLCSLATSLPALVAARVLQAIAGSMLNPVAMSIITNTFTDPRERARAIGVWAGVVGLSLALGPVLGGILVQAVGWPAIFWVNVPVALLAVALTAAFVPQSRASRPRRPDPVGQVLVLVALAALTYGIIEGPAAGWVSPRILGCFGLSAAAVTTLVAYERRRTEPLIELRFFGSVPFAGATVIAVSALAALSGFLFLNSLYLQDVRGFGPLRAGLTTLPLAAMSLVFAPLSGRLLGARGARPPLVIAGTAMAAGALLLTDLRRDTPVGLLLAAYVVFGFGFSMVNSPITYTAVSGMPAAQAGLAAAIASTSRQVGQSLGVAVAGSVVAAALATPGGTGFPAASHVAWWLVCGAGVLVLVLGLATTGARARASADRVAAGFACVSTVEPARPAAT